MNETTQGEKLLYELMPHLSTQIRIALTNIHTALENLAPAEKRDQDTALDANAAGMTQGVFRLMRMCCELELAPMMAESAALDREDTDLVMWLQELVAEAEPLFEVRGVALRLDCALRCHVTAIHPIYLRRALWQLLDNALKYTEPGGHVTLSLQCIDAQVLIRLTDDGCGIPPERMREAFSLYLSPARIEQFPHGLGLGLPLARRIAERHGGRLLLNSTVDEGTQVTMALPDDRSETMIEMPRTDYTGGFQASLLELADALPPHAFRVQNLDD